MSKTPIFAVEQGSYSDYRVVGVFSTREAADRLCARLNKQVKYRGDEASVEAWILDPAVSELNAGMEVFLVRMYRDGVAEHVEHYPGGFEVENEFRLCNTAWHHPPDRQRQKFLVATVWATDPQHAIKIVNERRGQMIAMGEWEDAS